MKKIVTLLIAQFLMVHVYAQFQIIVDNAVRGTGTNQFNYVGSGWVHGSNTVDPYYKSTVSFSNVAENYLTLTFIGNQAEFYAAKAPHHGIAAISVDNGPETDVDLYAPSRENYAKVYSTNIFNFNQTHTLKIRVKGTKNPLSTGTYVIVDYLKIFPEYSQNNISLTNTFNGYQSFVSNYNGVHNVAVGPFSLHFSRDGDNNTAIGYNSQGNSVSGDHNTSVGAFTLAENTAGGFNTAVGSFALNRNSTGFSNIAVGRALMSNTSGFLNVCLGMNSMLFNTTGSYNVAVGPAALHLNQGGSYNTAVGNEAGTAFIDDGIQNSTAIGNLAKVTAPNQVRIGNSSVTSIGGQVSWSTLSDGRFKKDIREDVSGLDFITKLRPVSYTVDRDAVDKFLRIPDSVRMQSTEARKKLIRQTGFVAQEIEDIVNKTGYVFHGVEVPQNENEHYSIRYAEFVVPLVKAVQELSTNDKEQKQVIQELKNELLSLKEELAEYKGGSLGLRNDDKETVLYQNNPNPFSADTEIKLSLPDDTFNAAVIIYNLEGRELKNIKVQGRGDTSIKISGKELVAGMYLYALIVDGKVIDTKRMILTQ